MTLRKFGISLAITAVTLSTIASIGSSPASAHRRSGNHYRHHHEHHQEIYVPVRPQPGGQVCYGIAPHKRCVPTG
jgi:hypothetical protein